MTSDRGKPTPETFGEGQEARRCNEPRDSNPYSPQDERHGAWKDGWDAADDPANSRSKGYGADA